MRTNIVLNDELRASRCRLTVAMSGIGPNTSAG